MIRSIGALMVSRFEYDVDAAAFISAAGITVQTQKNAINSLVVAAKTNGWWTLCNAIYPMVGGSAFTHKFNLKDPQDTDAAFRIDFLGGGWTHGSTGATPNGTTSYADTFLVPSTVLPTNDNHISYYSRTNVSSNSVDIGSDTDTSRRMLMGVRYNGNIIVDMYHFPDSRVSVANADSRGWFVGSRTSSTLLTAYKNGTSVGTSAGAPSTISGFSIYLANFNAAGTPSAVDYSTRECAFATIGAGISSTIAADMYTDIQAFQTSLARQV